MNRQEYIQAINDVIYLTCCAVGGTVPDERVWRMDLPTLYRAAERHMLTAVTAMALESAGVRDEDFSEAKNRAYRKLALMENDRKLLSERLDAAGIWYMPLKGAVLKDYYPAFGMRQMADYDILFDAARAEDVRQIMEELGFTVKSFGVTNHDIYYKEPVSNFELHRGLFGTEYDERTYRYYENVKERLIKDETSACGFRFSPDDFYIYLVAHEFKHYSKGGTGLRSLLDVYIFLNRFEKELNAKYIAQEMEKLGLTDFEKQNRVLVQSLFGGKKLTAASRAMLEYVMFSGTYGNLGNRVQNQVNRLGGGLKGRVKYILRRIFLPMKLVEVFFPFFYRHRILLPLLPFYRLVRGIFSRRLPRVKAELKALREGNNASRGKESSLKP